MVGLGLSYAGGCEAGVWVCWREALRLRRALTLALRPFPSPTSGRGVLPRLPKLPRLPRLPVLSIRLVLLALMVLLGMPGVVHAHSEGGGVPSLATAWSLSPWVLVPAAVLLAWYALGLVRLWRQAGVGRGVSGAGVVAFGAGVAALFAALVWPLDAYGEWSLAAHMAQHMLLLALAPPLLLAGRPAAVMSHAMPRAWLHAWHTVRRGLPAWTGTALTALAPAAIAHSAAMWAWHLPAALDLALARESVHGLMHASFLLAGVWFWAVLWHRVRHRDLGVVAGVAALIVVMMQMGLLGALLTFSPRALYSPYLVRAPELGLSPLADQQLAGLIMWVPSCLPYLAGGLWLMVQALRDSPRRSPH